MKKWIHSTTDLKTYTYRGPMSIRGRQQEINKTTQAVSEKKALSNIRFKLAQEHGQSVTDIRLNPDYLEEIKPKHEPKRCPNCGNYLTDSGECRYCDNSDVF